MEREQILQRIDSFSNKRKVTDIAIHCAATKEGQKVTVADIDKWHRQRGFNRIGYHFVIYLDGTIEPGRELDAIGAHVTGHNTHSIGICYIGGLDKKGKPKDTRTEAQKESLEWLISSLIKEVGTICAIKGHRDYPEVHKACPCFDAIPEYEHLTKKA